MKTKTILSLFLCVFLLCFFKLDVTAKNRSYKVTSGTKENSLLKPMGLTIIANEDGIIKLYWKSVTGASYYYVYYSTSLNGTYYKSSKIASNNTSFKNAKRGTTYYFRVKAFNGSSSSDYSKTQGITITDALDPPEEVDAQYDEDSGKVQIEWDEVDGADGYYVYYSESEDGDYQCATSNGIPKMLTSTSATWTNDFEDGDTYYIYITAVKGGMESEASEVESVTIGDSDQDSDSEYFSDLPNVPVIPGKDYDTSYSSDKTIVYYSYSMNDLNSDDISDYKALLEDNGWSYSKTTQASGHTVYVYKNGDDFIYLTTINGKFIIMGYV